MNTRNTAKTLPTAATPADQAERTLTMQELAHLAGGIKEVDPVAPGAAGKGNFNPPPDPLG